MGKSTQELKYKRLKVGHACYVCRSKKIKCDGLRPCMQCKARGRSCESSTNSSSTDAPPSELSTMPLPSEEEQDDNDSSNFGSDDDSILFSTKKLDLDDSKADSHCNNNWTSNSIHTSFENLQNNSTKKSSPFAAYPTFGSFVRWRNEPPLPSKYTYPIEMPSSDIQMHLIDLYFETRYKTTPMILKRLFYEQLRIKGPMITPLLLNSIYCVVSSYSTLPNIPKPYVFYNRAKRLLDDFLDTPRVTTVAALCLLSLYEPFPTKSKNMSDQHCRSWMFSGMAFRMCLELGLNIDTPYARSNLSLGEIEFRRRVFWSCYCLDKMQSAEWERLWSIPSSLVKTAFPQEIPGDDEEELCIVKSYEQKIRLAIIGEEGLRIRASFSIRTDILDSKFHDQLEFYRQNILKWRDNLPSPELWGLSPCNTIEEVIDNAPKISIVSSYLHVVFYYMLTDTLFCLHVKGKNSLEQRIYASQLTQSVEILCDQPSVVIRFDFLAHVTIAAIRVHARYLNDFDPVIARQSKDFFDRSVQILRKLQKHAIIPECSAVLTHLPIICQNLSETNNSSTTYSAPSSPQHFTPQVSSQYQQFSNDMLPQQQAQRYHHHQQQRQTFNEELLDPFRTEFSSVPSAGYQNMDNMSMASPYNSLAAFGSTFGVDFTNRRQLWEFAVQEGMNNNLYQDLGSSANSPVDTSSPHNMQSTPLQQQQGYINEDWTNHSPVATDFTWPAATPSQRSSTLSYSTSTYSPPAMQQIHHHPHWDSPVHLPENSFQQQPIMQQEQQQHQFDMTSSTSNNMNTLLSYSPTGITQEQFAQDQQQQHILQTQLCYPCFPTQ